ncbi:hypothetical protein B0J11DRAFT_564316 [Dendryphion nanum]|uniref:Uncharacterized protein n=1 Tax=Dendryphion nanum TaxID=256645 RepID=A0A9P9J339_9PLEO|nr:hypothetical protein B0J11DRAFT_564316 [Dendryphion nanum]
MGRISLLAQFLLGVQLSASLTIEIPTPLEARDGLEKRATDPMDEVVFLTDCRKYNSKDSDDKDVVEHVSFALYHDTYDYTRNNASLSWQAFASPSYPNGQRIDSMGGAFVDWTAGKQDDRIDANFDKLERRFWVHGLSRQGDPRTMATGIASLGDHDMRCYKDTTNIHFPRNNWYYKCIADYYCTRKSRQIRRTLFSISEQTVDVKILGQHWSERKNAQKGEADPRIEGVISNVYYWLQNLDPKKGSVANEILIDAELKRQSGKKHHSVRMNWKAGQISSDATYDPNRIKQISKKLQDTLEPEIFKKVKVDTQAFWDSDYLIYKAPFPANVNIQVQIAFQEQLDWKPTDVIDVDIITHGGGGCGSGAAWAKALSGLFGGVAAVVTGGASAVLSGLGGIAGGYHTAACLSA